MKVVNSILLIVPFLVGTVFSMKNLGIQKLATPRNRRGVEFTDVVGPFPSNPTYAPVYSYSDSSCNSQLTEVRTGLLNACFMGSDGTTMKVTCGANGLTQTYYSDNACTVVSTETPDVIPNNCSASGSEDIYDAYWVSDCTNIGTNAYFAYPSDFVVHSWYSSTQCATNQVVITRGFLNNYCLQLSATASYNWVYPVFSVWATSDSCEGTFQSQEAVSSSCILADDDGYATYQTYNNWILTSSGSSSDDSLSTGAIVGIVIGVVAGVLLFGAMIYYFFFMKSASLSSQADSKV